MASKSQQESAAAQNRQPVRRDYDASRESPSLAAAVEMEDKDTPEVQTETEAAPVELLPTEERDMFGKLRHGAAVALDTILHPRSVDKQARASRAHAACRTAFNGMRMRAGGERAWLPAGGCGAAAAEAVRPHLPDAAPDDARRGTQDGCGAGHAGDGAPECPCATGGRDRHTVQAGGMRG